MAADALAVCGSCSEAACSSGYTPFLNFDIQDLSEAVPRLLMLGATMDGPIKYPAHGKVCARSLAGDSDIVAKALTDFVCVCMC